jgi:hypothetical protein
MGTCNYGLWLILKSKACRRTFYLQTQGFILDSYGLTEQQF